MDKSWLPTVAGVLDIIAGVFALGGCLAISFGGYVVGSVPEANDFPLPRRGHAVEHAVVRFPDHRSAGHHRRHLCAA